MGLFRDMYGIVSQSQQADLAEKQFNAEMELKQKYYERQMQQYNETNRRKEEVYAGISELGVIDKTIGETSFQKTMMEQRFQKSALKDPEEASRFMIESQVLAKRLQDLNNIRKVKGAELTYKSIDGQYAKAKALDLADFLNGREVSDSGMATVTKKRKILDESGMDTGETETVTMKVPQSQAGFGGYVSGEAQAPQPSSYNAYSMAGAMIDSSAPLGNSTPEYAMPIYRAQSRNQLMADVANVPVASQETQPMQVPQAQPQADTEAVRQQALSAMSRAQTPEQRQKIKDRAAQMGVNLP
jgi:hypothetical protein